MFKSTGEDPSPVAGPSKLPARRTSPGPPTLPDKVKATYGKATKGKLQVVHLDPDQIERPPERPATRSRTKEAVTKGPAKKVSKQPHWSVGVNDSDPSQIAKGGKRKRVDDEESTAEGSKKTKAASSE